MQELMWQTSPALHLTCLLQHSQCSYRRAGAEKEMAVMVGISMDLLEEVEKAEPGEEEDPQGLQLAQKEAAKSVAKCPLEEEAEDQVARRCNTSVGST